MKLLCLTALVFCQFYSHSQETATCSELTRQFLQDILGNRFKENTLFVKEELDSFTVSEIKKTVGDGRFERKVTYDGHIRTDSLILTPKELARVKKQLKNQQQSWLTGCLQNVKLIPKDTISYVFKNMGKGWDYFHKTYGDRLYRISTPIFLRKNSICLFYWSYGCGPLCGQGTLALYKKENGKWVHYWSLLDWIS
jgi:hypothetical protein